MSQENVEIVRRLYDAYLSGDFEAALALIDPEVNGTDRSVRKARSTADVREWSRHYEPGRDVGGVQDRSRRDRRRRDQVVVVEEQSGRGKGSGLPLTQQNCSVFTLRDGRIARAVFFRDREDAQKAAGLRD